MSAYDLVVVFRFFHRPLLPAIAWSVAPGGFLVYETFHRQDRIGGGEGRGRRRGTGDPPAHAALDGELAAAFGELEPVLSHDGVERDGRRFSQFLGRLAATRARG